MKRFLLPIMSASTLILAITTFFLYQKTQNPQNLYRVQKVIDGDTYTLTSGESYRLINIEAPELNYCAGDLAKQKLAAPITNKL